MHPWTINSRFSPLHERRTTFTIFIMGTEVTVRPLVNAFLLKVGLNVYNNRNKIARI